MAKLDLTGQVFGKLKVLCLDEEKSTSNRKYWNCQCECGNTISTRADYLRGGKSKSCGCYRESVFKTSYSKHGMWGTRFYKIWKSMISRCYYDTDSAYERYGGRGIRVCKEWKEDFVNFYNDMYESYKEHSDKYGENETTIEIIDFNGNYEPSNCTWKTNLEQGYNKRNNILVEGKTLKEISEEYRTDIKLLKSRSSYYKSKGIELTIENMTLPKK